jgi:putative SOS response-associated peptidase YedK
MHLAEEKMCFRVVQEGEDVGALIRAIEDIFGDMVVQDDLHTGSNIALTDNAMVVLQRKELQLRNMRFGLVPHWKDKAEYDLNLGNARAETVDSLPSFKEPFERRRCLIPVTGFYEWRLDPGENRKTPYKVVTDDPVFFLAGVWDFWQPGQLASFAIITTEPNHLIRQLHNRMPVILPKEFHRAWLNPENSNVAALKGMLQPYPAEQMAYQAYSRYVSSARNKDKSQIIPVGEPVRLLAAS